MRTEEAELKFRKYLASQKLRYTPERRKIVRAVFSARDHFQADELYMRLKAHNQRVSRATVYRTLDLLVKLGFVQKVCVGDRSSIYQSALNGRRFGHLICLVCGKIQKFELPEIENSVEKVCREFHFVSQNGSVQISGYCETCRNESLVDNG